MAVAVPILVVPSYTFTTLFASAVPVRFKPPLALLVGVAIVGAVGATVSTVTTIGTLVLDVDAVGLAVPVVLVLTTSSWPVSDHTSGRPVAVTLPL